MFSFIQFEGARQLREIVDAEKVMGSDVVVEFRERAYGY